MRMGGRPRPRPIDRFHEKWQPRDYFRAKLVGGLLATLRQATGFAQ
jgi:hypothetical protein